MKTEPTRLLRENIWCLDNGHESFTYVATGDGYGELIGRTPLNEQAMLNTWRDKESAFFDRVNNMVMEILEQEEFRTGHCFSKVLGVACDPAPSGHLYSFTGKIWCPICGSTNLKYGISDPPQVDIVDFPQITHTKWDSLSADEQEDLLEDALREAGCIPWEQYLKDFQAGRFRDW